MGDRRVSLTAAAATGAGASTTGAATSGAGLAALFGVDGLEDDLAGEALAILMSWDGGYDG